MSFWPFPKTLLDETRAGLLCGPGVELGSGDGVLHERLASAGIELTTSDLRAPSDVRLDATRLPFTSKSLGLLVAGNLLRHLAPGERQRLLREAGRVLADDGRILLLEDDPSARNTAEENYRVTLDLLAQADVRRGGVLDLAPVIARESGADLETVFEDTIENQERPLDPFLPLDWLSAQRLLPAAKLAAHRARVVEHGMEYGRYQACLLQRRKRREGN